MIPEELKRKEGEDIEVMTEDLEVYEAWANHPLMVIITQTARPLQVILK